MQTLVGVILIVVGLAVWYDTERQPKTGRTADGWLDEPLRWQHGVGPLLFVLGLGLCFG